ncbi:hypothetical protein HJFPF1_08557 [Paramyrothecium foliicola]|nr:hypothetical protein HJFPF1_08557 [Paramyrothecium foliicola]
MKNLVVKGCFPEPRDRHITKKSYALLNYDNNVSQNGGWACDGCDGDVEIANYNIKRLEMWDETESDKAYYRITKSGVGYFTAYQQPDGTYELVSAKKVGDPFAHQGTCVRAPSNSHRFSCRNIPEIASTSGKHMLTGVSCSGWSASFQEPLC